ncbi:MAG: hypothetical protein FJW20_10090 [Acidimicrobiia bacterium]|nr:hypothetical protein [Acidimicrobiia bacterium]
MKSDSPWLLWPREHGAWGMVSMPFLSAFVVADALPWQFVPSMVAVAALFLARAPLIVVGRQWLVWKDRHEETSLAVRSLWVEAAAMALSGLLLGPRWGWAMLTSFGAIALAFTFLAAWMTVRNRQREVWFQIVGAAGLSASALAGSLTALGQIAPWGWWLWAMHTAHATAGVLTVHARIEAKIAARTGKKETAEQLLRQALMAQLFLVAGCAWLAMQGKWLLAAAFAVSWITGFGTLAQLRGGRALDTPLTKVGLRALAVSMLFSAAVIAGLR